MNEPQIILATDHAGFERKEAVKARLLSQGYEVLDLGAHNFDPEDDYPDYMHQAALMVAEKPQARKAIVFGGSGEGEAMVMNRYKGVRCLGYNGPNLEIVSLSRKHNDANGLSIGARFVSEGDTLEAVDVWLDTAFEGGRHVDRIAKIDEAYEQEDEGVLGDTSQKIALLGVLCIFGAYSGLTLGLFEAGVLFGVLNLAGAAFVGYDARKNANMPAVSLSNIWLLVAIVGIIQGFL
jgi:ribose 5-phosphate isomerase B